VIRISVSVCVCVCILVKLKCVLVRSGDVYVCAQMCTYMGVCMFVHVCVCMHGYVWILRIEVRSGQIW